MYGTISNMSTVGVILIFTNSFFSFSDSIVVAGARIYVFIWNTVFKDVADISSLH